MTIRVAILHKTTYEFDRDVNVSPHVLRLRPAPHSRTHIHGYSLKVLPEKHFINWQQDAFLHCSIYRLAVVWVLAAHTQRNNVLKYREVRSLRTISLPVTSLLT